MLKGSKRTKMNARAGQERMQVSSDLSASKIALCRRKEKRKRNETKAEKDDDERERTGCEESRERGEEGEKGEDMRPAERGRE